MSQDVTVALAFGFVVDEDDYESLNLPTKNEDGDLTLVGEVIDSVVLGSLNESRFVGYYVDSIDARRDEVQIMVPERVIFMRMAEADLVHYVQDLLWSEVKKNLFEHNLAYDGVVWNTMVEEATPIFEHIMAIGAVKGWRWQLVAEWS